MTGPRTVHDAGGAGALNGVKRGHQPLAPSPRPSPLVAASVDATWAPAVTVIPAFFSLRSGDLGPKPLCYVTNNKPCCCVGGICYTAKAMPPRRFHASCSHAADRRLHRRKRYMRWPPPLPCQYPGSPPIHGHTNKEARSFALLDQNWPLSNVCHGSSNRKRYVQWKPDGKHWKKGWTEDHKHVPRARPILCKVDNVDISGPSRWLF